MVILGESNEQNVVLKNLIEGEMKMPISKLQILQCTAEIAVI